MTLKLQIVFFIVFVSNLGCWGQSYEDKRCRCICPSPAAVINGTINTTRNLYIANVPPKKCNCEDMVLSHMRDMIKGHELEYCPRCECKYETRNTTIIMVVVIMVIWVLILLAVYLGFLMCLDPLIKKKKVRFYREGGTEESCSLLVSGEDEY